MTVRLGIFSILLLVLPYLGLAQTRQVLQPSDHGRDHSSTSIITFADPDLGRVVRAALSVGTQEDISCETASQLTALNVPAEIERVVYGGTLRASPSQPFESLEGIQDLTNLACWKETPVSVVAKVASNLPSSYISLLFD